MVSTSSDEMDAIRQRLIETGDWDRIQKLLRAQLVENGWVDDLKDMTKEKARAQETPNLENLIRQVSDSAKAMVGEGVRRDIVQEIESVLDREVEQA